MKKNILNSLKIILVVALIVFAIVVIKCVINKEEIPFFSARSGYIVLSGSMEPKINIGDIVISTRAKKEDISVGDIVTFRNGSMVVTHRIVEMSDENGVTEYTTKGDGNNTNDIGTIKYEDIVGKLSIIIPKLGYVVLFIRKNLVLVTVVVSFAVLFSLTRPEKEKIEKVKEVAKKEKETI